MRPQLQKYRGEQADGVHGDCHRTCIAMILNMDRDDVPHFMEDCAPGLPPDHPDSIRALRKELGWLAQHGLTAVNVPFPGEQDIGLLLEQFKHAANGAPIVLGCSSPNGNHSVVIWEGEIYNPNNGIIVGPMNDGFWWLTIYSVGPNWQTRAATKELAFRAGYEAGVDWSQGPYAEVPNNGVEDAIANYLQPAPVPPTVDNEQEIPSNV